MPPIHHPQAQLAAVVAAAVPQRPPPLSAQPRPAPAPALLLAQQAVKAQSLALMARV
jgi:hypothetical protein